MSIFKKIIHWVLYDFILQVLKNVFISLFKSREGLAAVLTSVGNIPFWTGYWLRDNGWDVMGIACYIVTAIFFLMAFLYGTGFGDTKSIDQLRKEGIL